MKVIFVHHSCFVVEMEDVVLIFDYFEGILYTAEANRM